MSSPGRDKGGGKGTGNRRGIRLSLSSVEPSQGPETLPRIHARAAPARGSRTDRAMLRLSRPNHKAWLRPPSVGKETFLPGLNERYFRPVKTPPKERSAGERAGHAGLVTSRGRKALDTDMFAPLLALANESVSNDTQKLAAHAMAALSGVASNRKVLSSYGAVEVMMQLAKTGKSAEVRLDAWDALLQILQCSEASRRFDSMDGIKLALDCVQDRSPKIKRVGVQVMARLLAKHAVKTNEEVNQRIFAGMCLYVKCNDPLASERAGQTLFQMVKGQAEGQAERFNQTSLHDLVQVVVQGPGVYVDNWGKVQVRRGHKLCLRALAHIVTSDAKACAECATGSYLPGLLKRYFQHGVEVGRVRTSDDLAYARCIANICMVCRLSKMRGDTEVYKWLAACLPRFLLVLLESIPRDQPKFEREVHPEKSTRTILKSIDVFTQASMESVDKFSHKEHKPKDPKDLLQGKRPSGFMLLPDEYEMQYLIGLLISRFIFCLPAARLHLFETGYLPCLLELCRSRFIKVRQNAALCIYYLVQDEEVQRNFCSAPNPDGTGMADPLQALLKSAYAPDALVKLTLLKVVRKLVLMAGEDKSYPHAQLMADKGLCELLIFLMEEALDPNHQEVQGGSVFGMLRFAFMAGNIVFHLEDIGARGINAALEEHVPHGRTEAIFEELLHRHGEQAAKAMKDDGTMEARHDSQTANDTRKALWEIAKKTQLIGTLDTTVKGIKEKQDSMAIKKAEEERLERIFRRYDTDGSGSIDGDELHDLLRALGHICSRDEAQRIMSGMDRSGDGSIDFNEFVSWWSNASFTDMFGSSAINR